MPGSTSLGIPYPFQNEPVTSTSWLNMAAAIDGLFTSLQTLQVQASNFPSSQISGGAANAVVNNTTTTVPTFSSTDWNNGGYANLGVNPDRLTVPSGIYAVTASGSMGSVTTLTTARITILGAGTTTWGGASVDIAGTGGTTSVTLSSPTAIFVTNVAAILQLQVYWQGTGGPPNFTNLTLQAVQIRPFYDV